MRAHESLISHDRLPCAQLCVMITGADLKQETSTEGLNTGSSCNTGVRASDNGVMSVCQTKKKLSHSSCRVINKVNEV